jgi:hypothetical protein
VDALGSGDDIVTLDAPDNGASNVDGSYDDPSDDATNATAEIANNVGPANAVAAHDFDTGADDLAIAEIFQGTTVSTGTKVGDCTVSGPGSSVPGDIVLSSDDVIIGTQITIQSLELSTP